MKTFFSLLILFSIILIQCRPVHKSSSTIPPQFQLATPNIQFNHILFSHSEEVQLFLNMKGVNIHYTLDGTSPTQRSQLYSSPITIETSCMLKAKAFHPDFKPSDEINQRFINVQKIIQPKSARLDKPPTSNYPGEAVDLIDLKKGILDFKASEWMGFKSDATLFITLKEPATFQKIIVSSLSNPDSWIMPPSGIIIEISDDGKDYSNIHQKNIPLLTDYKPASLVFPTVEFSKPITTSFLKITVKSAGKLPNWHSGKGYASWLFLDEIMIL